MKELLESATPVDMVEEFTDEYRMAIARPSSSESIDRRESTSSIEEPPMEHANMGYQPTPLIRVGLPLVWLVWCVDGWGWVEAHVTCAGVTSYT